MPVVVYRYGTHARTALSLPEAVYDQLRLANQLWNRLVEIDQWREAEKKTMWSQYEDVASTETRIAALDQRATTLIETISAARAAQRTRAPRTPAIDELRQVKTEIAAARADRRAAISTHRKDAKPELARIETDTRAKVKAMYREFRDGGLYWAVYNDVVDHWSTACKRVQADREKGRASTLRFHRFDGSGALAVQLQRSATQPPRTPELLADPKRSPWRNVLRLPWIDPDTHPLMPRSQRRRAGRLTASMRVGAAPIDVPITMHRPLPADADVTGARLVLTRCAAHTDVHLDATVRLPDPEPVERDPVAAVHIGWRREDDDSIRAATIRWDRPGITPPEALTRIVRVLDARTAAVVLPASWIKRMAAHEAIQSERDKRLDEVRDLAARIVDQTGADQDDDRLTTIRQWRSLSRLGALARRWLTDPPPGADPQDLAALEHWRAWDRRQWETAEHSRRKWIRRRDETWKQVAAWIADQAGHVIVDDVSVASLARRPALTDEENLPESITTGVWAGQRVDAAPGLLRGKIQLAADRRGIRVTEASAAGVSRECPGCGTVSAEAPGPGSREVTCPDCGRVRDVDEAAAGTILARGLSAVAPSTDRSTAGQSRRPSTLGGRRRKGQVQ